MDANRANLSTLPFVDGHNLLSRTAKERTINNLNKLMLHRGKIMGDRVQQSPSFRQNGFWAEVPVIPGCATQGVSVQRFRISGIRVHKKSKQSRLPRKLGERQVIREF